MVKIGFIGCHEISEYCLKKICELSEYNKDVVSVVFNLKHEDGEKHSAYTDFNLLKEKFGFPIFYVSKIGDEEIKI